MTKRFLSVILAVFMILSSIPALAMQLESVETFDEIATNNVENGVLQGGDFEGGGTAADPYIIADAEDFIAFTNEMNEGENYKDKYFVQTADIDLAGNAAYTGCVSEKFFKGVYDGQGHKINVNISAENKFVFSYVDGTIMNLGFTGSMINTANNRCAPILCLNDNSKLINCYSTLAVTAGNGNVSGFAGSMKSSATAVNCYFAGSFPGSHVSAGGIYRTGAEPAPTCINCYSTIADKMNNNATVRPGVTIITESTAKTTLADTLNSGREDAAEVAGVSVDSIYHWKNVENGYPELYLYVAPADPGITGTGTKNDPYVIDSASDFITFTNEMNDGEKYKDKYFVQSVDIDLARNTAYTGCNDAKYFQGVYDGQGHTINVDISDANKFVFGYVQYGIIMNLGFTGSIENTSGHGVPIRYLLDGGKLVNCYSTLTVKSGTSNVSGFVGTMKNGIAVNCYFAGSFLGSPRSAGGIYRTPDLNAPPICINCYSTKDDVVNGTVTSRDGVEVITDEAAKTTLVDKLNSGRDEAAEVAGVSVDSIYRWTNKNGYPTMYVLVCENIELASNSSTVLEYSENITVIDEFNSAVIENNGTKAVTITGKGYNGVLLAQNEAGETVAKVTIVGGNKLRPGLNIFTGTKDGYDIETSDLFDESDSVSVVANSTNSSNKVLKIASGTADFDAQLTLGTPIEWDRPYRVDYDVRGKVNSSFKHIMNTTGCTLTKYGTANISESEWKHIAVATNPLWKVDKGAHPYLNKFIIQGDGVEGDDSYALYIDNFSIIPAYKVEYFNATGESIDVAFYNPMKADGVEVFLAETYKVDYNANANYVVNGTPVDTNGEYTLAYEDLKITVLPNDNAIMFSGMNATIVVPEEDTYVIPYPHELAGFLADDFVVWMDAEGNEIEPGTTVNTADYIGKTIYAYCDANEYPRSPANREVVNMASFRHNSWIANYQPGNIARKADMETISERGVSFRWEAVSDAVSYTVYYGLDRYMTDAKSVTSTTTNAKAYHLLNGTKYYWCVEATLSDGSKTTTDVWTFTTADVINTYSYINNMRDIGGMVTEDGLYRIKHNMAIRNGAIDGNNTTKIMEKFGLKAELDLRGNEAGGRTESPLGKDVKYILIQGTHYIATVNDPVHYKHLDGQARLKEEVQVFADINNYPLNFHCSAGRDRTGMLAYVIEGLLGIPEDEIMRDYELSWLSGSAASQEKSAKYFIAMNEFHDYINTFDGETFKDRMESFCLYIGVTQEEIDNIREILLEPTDKLQPNTLKVGSMRLTGVCGIRVAGFVTAQARDAAEEYGFIVALDKNFTNGDYSELKVNSESVKTVTGVAYNKENGIDKVYADALTDPYYAQSIFGIEATDKLGVYFTGVYTGIPDTKQAYTTDLVGRTYAKINGKYYYGAPVVKNLYDIAKAVEVAYTEKGQPIPEYVEKVVGTVEAQ